MESDKNLSTMLDIDLSQLNTLNLSIGHHVIASSFNNTMPSHNNHNNQGFNSPLSKEIEFDKNILFKKDPNLMDYQPRNRAVNRTDSNTSGVSKSFEKRGHSNIKINFQKNVNLEEINSQKNENFNNTQENPLYQNSNRINKPPVLPKTNNLSNTSRSNHKSNSEIQNNLDYSRNNSHRYHPTSDYFNNHDQ